MYLKKANCYINLKNKSVFYKLELVYNLKAGKKMLDFLKRNII